MELQINHNVLYSPCCNCEFKICIKCMNMHYNKVYTLNKFKCLCTKNELYL